jgi:hypothetical protein
LNKDNTYYQEIQDTMDTLVKCPDLNLVNLMIQISETISEVIITDIYNGEKCKQTT